MTDESLEQQIAKLKAEGPRFVKNLEDANVRPAVILLTEAVLRLDATSSRLAKVNIGLTVVIALLTVVQLAVTVFHH